MVINLSYKSLIITEFLILTHSRSRFFFPSKIFSHPNLNFLHITPHFSCIIVFLECHLVNIKHWFEEFHQKSSKLRSWTWTWRFEVQLDPGLFKHQFMYQTSYKGWRRRFGARGSLNPLFHHSVLQEVGNSNLMILDFIAIIL